MAAASNPPLKRHVSLQPLSRDHYVGLVKAQHLIKSADAGPNDRVTAVGEFLEAWASEISAHFADEERLLPDLAPREAVERLRREHRALRALAEEAQQRAATSDPGSQWVRALGQLLNDHIRWEERELFPQIERAASEEQLRRLTEQTERIEASRPRNVRRSASRKSSPKQE